MSKHSKNNTSQSIFTYGERQKLKGLYGSREDRISQDSIKKFEMCTICNSRIIEPVCCDQGHIFCRTCAIEYLVKQKKKILENNEQAEKEKKRVEEKEVLKKVEDDAKRIMEFEKYDNFEELGARAKFITETSRKEEEEAINPKESKPVGMYELTAEKDKYLKSSFWTIENTPAVEEKIEKKGNVVKCPGADHKLTLKKLRTIIAKQIEGNFVCGICNKQIGRQKIGSYKCGHMICLNCKSDKCQICDKAQGWTAIESSSSAFASQGKAQVKTYSHAFYM